MEPTATSFVSKCISWDTNYSEVIDQGKSSSELAIVEKRTHSMRMPSVIVSDFSEVPNSENNVKNIKGRSESLLSLSTTNLVTRKLPRDEESSDEGSDACSFWGSQTSPSSSGSLLNSAEQTSSPPLPGDELITNNLLSVRRLSECSSSSSLATLDMEPYCSSNQYSNETISDAFGVIQETGTYDLRFSISKDVAASRVDVSPDPSESNTPQKTINNKISAWKKVRSAVQWTPFIQAFRKQRYPWVQLAGHQGNFKVGGESGTILKKLCPREESCFQLLMDDPLRPFIPSYKGNVVADDGEKFLVLEDLLGDFSNPNVMDCKLGVRTYLEDELAKAKLKPKLRKDMFEKMLQIDPNAPTAEELRLEGITKPRYMVWRETISSTATLGFRIEGIRKQNGNSSKDFKTVSSAQQILGVLRDFVKEQPQALTKYINRLEELDATLAISNFFSNHELIGSSLLFVHDNTKANVWMIDFAKTHQLPSGVTINHRTPWRVGNHEDGYLIGLSSLIKLLKQLLEEQGNNPRSSDQTCANA